MDELRERFAAYIERHHPEWGALTSFRKLTAGWESEIFVFTVAESPFVNPGVLRLYTDPMTARREPVVLRTMDDLGYPVPAVWGGTADPGPLGAPFLVIDYVDGGVMDELFADPSTRAGAEDRFGELLARLHRLPPEPLVERLGSSPPIRGRLAGWRRAAPPGFVPVVEWLFDRSRRLVALTPSVLHRDFHPHNVVVGADGSERVIDWGHAEVGDRRLDLAWTLLLFASFDGPEAADAILAAYRAHSDVALPDLEFFDALAATLRLHHFVESVTGAAGGMRAEAVEEMATMPDVYRSVHDRLEDRTGIRLAVVDRLLGP